VSILLVVVLLIPANLSLGVSFPVDLEPYRVVVGLLLLFWIAALLVDPVLQVRPTPFDRPIGFLVLSVVISTVANVNLLSLYSESVIKALAVLFSSLLIYFILSSVLQTRSDVDFLVVLLVVGATALGVAALFERATGYNVFTLVPQIPGLVQVPGSGSGGLTREGVVRASASAEHPIALGALLAFITPLSIYLASRTRVWLLATFVLILGCFVTVSRTPIVMLAATLIVFSLVRPRHVLGLIAVLPVAVTAAYLLLPGVVGPAVDSFVPAGGLVQQQSTALNQGGSGNVGRLGDFHYAFQDIKRRPLYGGGLGTRVRGNGDGLFSREGRYLETLDNQWLGVLLDLGILGVISLVWLFATSARKLLSEARVRGGPDGWLALALAAASVSFGTGMLFFDAFAFTQVTIVFFATLAISAVFLRTLPESTLGLVDAAPDWNRLRVVDQLRRIMDWTATR